MPASLANRPVSPRVYPDRIVIAAEGQILCAHERVIDRSHQGPGRTVYEWWHYLSTMHEHHRKKVRFFSTVELVNALEREKAMNKAGQLAKRLMRLDLVILNELGHLTFSPSGGAIVSREGG